MNGLLRSAVAILSGRLFRLVLTVLFTPLLVRLLSVEEYGVYAYLMAIVGVLTVVAPLGLFDSVRKHVAESPRRSEEEAPVVAAATVLSLLYSLIVVALFLVSNRVLQIVPDRFAHLVVAILLANNLFQVYRGVFHGRRREHVSELFESAMRVVYVTLALGLAYYGYGVRGVIAAYAASLLVAVFALALATSTVDCRTVTRNAFERCVERVAPYGLVQAVGGVAAVMLYKIDIVLVEYFGSSAETALYQAALLPAEYVWFVPSAIQMALLQNASYHWSRDDVDRLNENARRCLKYAVAALILFGVGLFTLSPEFAVAYFGPEYEASALPLRILLVGTLFFGVNRVLVPVLQATGRLRYTEVLTVAALVLNVVLNVLLIPRHGIVGAAVGTSVSYVFMFVGGLMIWHRSEFVFLTGSELLRLGALFVAFAVPFWTAVRVASLPPLMALVVFPTAGFAWFCVLALALRLVTTDEIVRGLRAAGIGGT
jgi:O-antigen/teichoic acid export membrane protein